MARNIFINTMILAFTMLAVAGILVVGTDTGAEVPPEVAVGQPAPDFTLHYYEDGMQTITPADLKGKPTILSVIVCIPSS